jgi:hypothetical protein
MIVCGRICRRVPQHLLSQLVHTNVCWWQAYYWQSSAASLLLTHPILSQRTPTCQDVNVLPDPCPFIPYCILLHACTQTNQPSLVSHPSATVLVCPWHYRHPRLYQETRMVLNRCNANLSQSSGVSGLRTLGAVGRRLFVACCTRSSPEAL